MSNVIELKNVTKKYKGFTLDNMNLTLPKGYIMGFIGPNGAGKSTTIKLMMNLVKKDHGDIKIFGLDHIEHEREIKERIGFVYDENHFYNDISIEQMKKIIAPFYRKWDEKKFQQYLRDFDLPPKRKIKDLSKGMKMKFSLAIALSHGAELIIMDEPTSGLDPIFRRELLDILGEVIQDEKKSIFFSTHITTDLDKIADYVTFINQGNIIFSEEKDEILENYGVVKGSKDLLRGNIKQSLIGLRENQFGFEGLTAQVREIKKIYKDQITIEKPSLEDIMVYTVRGNKNASINY